MIIALNKLDESLKKHYDVFIASASFEKRSRSISETIIGRVELTHKLVSLSVPHKDLIVENLKFFEVNEFNIVEIDNSRQLDTVDNFLTRINEILTKKNDSSFLIDISTFTRQTLLILLRLLRNILLPINHIQLVYTPAKEYSVGLPYSEKWLTRGTLKVNSIFGYLGIIRPSRAYHLIILMGFEVERAAALIDAYEPLKISIGYARKSQSIADEHYELNKAKFDELLSEFPNAESFEFSCIAVDDCKNDILHQAKKYKSCNVVISPMNNKISTIACALAAFENEEVQLAVSIPALYNHENYSIPGDLCYLVEMSGFIKNL